MIDNKGRGHQGEHIVAAFLFGQGWQATIIDAVGYDIVATSKGRVIRLQVKSTEKALLSRNTRRYGFTVGMGREKHIRNNEDHYNILALCACDTGNIYFIPAAEVNRKTYKFNKEFFHDKNLSTRSWKRTIGLI